jgi:DNA-directed RNA polymerase specialized sigma24 family protein
MKKQKKPIPIKIKPQTNLPNGVNTEEFLQALENISKRLANKFRFAYHSVEDMKQQAAIFALEGLENYDNKRPLENFLWTHVRNRLFNYKRNNYQRPDKPCHSCPFFDKTYKLSLNQCEKYCNKDDCELYSAWAKRNEVKKNIIQPSYIETSLHQSVQPTDFDLSIQNQELIKFLDTSVQSEFRESYLKLKHGAKISKLELKKLQQHIFTLMEANNWKLTTFQENEDN